jgi:hypothetical protein
MRHFTGRAIGLVSHELSLTRLGPSSPGQLGTWIALKRLMHPGACSLSFGAHAGFIKMRRPTRRDDDGVYFRKESLLFTTWQNGEWRPQAAS